MSEEYSEILEQAYDIAERASKIALSHFRQALLIEMKENMTPVTIADKKTEEMIRNELTMAFPDFGILGEEFGEDVKKSEYVWTVDPIDGTRSFIRGIPLFGTLLGLLKGDEPVVGVMILPALNENYLAAKGIGTYCNGVRLHVSSTKTLESAVVAVGDIQAFEDSGKQAYLDKMMKTAELCRGYTDCFGHSLVLRGAVDAMIDPIVNVWDVAPLACLIREAGGDYCSFDGERTFRSPSFLTYTPGLKASVLNP